MAPLLRYLHLSDLHFHDGNAVQNHNEKSVNNSLLEAIEEQLKDKLLDFIIITGDIAFSGQREEYALALKFCERLLEITGVEKKRLFLVAGNHDLDRTKISKRQLRFYEFDTQDEVSETLADPTLRPLIMGKFAEFHEFAEQARGERHYDETVWHMSKVLRLNKAGQSFSLNLLGLNSALFAGYDGDDKQKLALGLYQVEPALEQLDEEAPLSIGFFHHPFSCLHEVEKPTTNRLRKALDLILTGHLHKPENAVISDGAGLATIIGAGAAYESRESKNSINWVEIDLSNGQGQVHYLKYVQEHHVWNRDVDINPHHPDGLFEFTIPAIAKQPLTPQEVPTTPTPSELVQPFSVPDISSAPVVHFIHDYLLPDNFTGRKEEQQRLQAMLRGDADPQGGKHAAVIAICALGGMGKSALARQLFAQMRQQESSHYRYLVWFSFYEARSEEDITGVWSNPAGAAGWRGCLRCRATQGVVPFFGRHAHVVSARWPGGDTAQQRS